MQLRGARAGEAVAAGSNRDPGSKPESGIHVDILSGNTHRASSGSEDVEMSSTSDSSYNYKLSINDDLNLSTPSKKQTGQKKQLKRGRSGHCEDDVEVCPISSLGLVEESKPRPRGCHPGVLLWVEPADSGFLDMVSNAPAGQSHAGRSLPLTSELQK